MWRIRDGRGRRRDEGQPSLAAGKPALALIPTGLLVVLVVASVVSGWRIRLGGVAKGCDPASTRSVSRVTFCVKRRFKQVELRHKPVGP